MRRLATYMTAIDQGSAKIDAGANAPGRSLVPLARQIAALDQR